MRLPRGKFAFPLLQTMSVTQDTEVKALQENVNQMPKEIFQDKIEGN